MLSKNKLKYLHSLELKKNRDEEHVFIAEGPKLVDELISHFQCRLLLATPAWQKAGELINEAEFIEVSQEELQRASSLKTPQEVIAVFEQPVYPIELNIPDKQLCLALDDVQDPGNLGTIIRIADWFGIEHLFCSLKTADAYNPKTVQATMGALARVKVHYLPLVELLSKLSSTTPVYGTFLNGDSIFKKELFNHGLIVMGNEGKGISNEVESYVSERLFIPNYSQGKETSESLNVAVATAITCAEFRRRFMM